MYIIINMIQVRSRKNNAPKLIKNKITLDLMFSILELWCTERVKTNDTGPPIKNIGAPLNSSRAPVNFIGGPIWTANLPVHRYFIIRLVLSI